MDWVTGIGSLTDPNMSAPDRRLAVLTSACRNAHPPLLTIAPLESSPGSARAGTRAVRGLGSRAGGPVGSARQWQRSCRQRWPSACRQARPPLSLLLLLLLLLLIVASRDRDGLPHGAPRDVGPPHAARPRRQHAGERCRGERSQLGDSATGAGRALTDRLALGRHTLGTDRGTAREPRDRDRSDRRDGARPYRWRQHRLRTPSAAQPREPRAARGRVCRRADNRSRPLELHRRATRSGRPGARLVGEGQRRCSPRASVSPNRT